jgi:hypothetical protein
VSCHVAPLGGGGAYISMRTPPCKLIKIFTPREDPVRQYKHTPTNVVSFFMYKSVELLTAHNLNGENIWHHARHKYCQAGLKNGLGLQATEYAKSHVNLEHLHS